MTSRPDSSPRRKRSIGRDSRAAAQFAPLEPGFYDRPTDQVARELLGKQMVRADRQGVRRGRIVEVEAYLSVGDPACHAARGRNRKNASMFGSPGTAYVYAIHARWCFNVVTEGKDVPCAVLIRALEPLEGQSCMHARRGIAKPLDLARGPARLCEALDIDRQFDGWNLARGEQLWIASDPTFDSIASRIGVSGRIGISAAQELPLRFFLRDTAYVSGPKRLNGPPNTSDD